MAAVPRRILRVGRVVVPIRDHASKDRNVDVDRNMPDQDLQAGRETSIDQTGANRIIDGLDRQAAIDIQLEPIALDLPKADLVALHNFAKTVQDSFFA